MKNFFLCFSFLIPIVILSQSPALIPLGYVTPGGLMDTVFDRFGNKHLITEMVIKPEDKSSGEGKSASSVVTCTAGMFVAYFANGSGMENLSNPLHSTRRQTVCEVLSNISGMLGYNSSYPNSALVKILVDDVTLYTAPVTPSASGVLGMATSYYVVPLNPASAHPGLTENLIQKTIISRVDAWTNVISPMAPINGNGLYHGMMAFNFANPFVNWNSGISTTATINQYDLYSVILHEVMHALGFASLISNNGLSKFGVANNYYSTYDKHLNRLVGGTTLVPLLGSGSSCNTSYGLTFTASASLLEPGCSTNYATDISNCASTIRYNSTLVPNMPVYTPACYEGEGSLSHFEDMCYPTNNPANNNLYFSMSNANGQGTNKRYLKLEEKNVLCDLGYTVANTYTSNAASASYTYSGGTCSTSPVWGVNDGLNNNTYLYTSTGGPIPIPITGSLGVIANDYQGSNPVTTITCVESVYNNGTAVVSSNNIIFTPNSTNGGIFVIRYVPINSSGLKGNITYIFGFIYPTFCGSVSPCDMVQNGGFENNSGCGSMSADSLVSASCWQVTTLSPDVFVRGCAMTSNSLSANLGVNTYSSSPIFNSYNGIPNNAVMGIGAYSGTNDLALSESLANYLGSPILNNQVYTLSFWAYQFVGTKLDPEASNTSIQSFNTSSISAVLSFATNSLFVPATYSVFTFPNSNLTIVKSVTLANSFNTWQHYSVTFTTSTVVNNGTWLYIGMDKNLTFSNILNAVGSGSASDILFYTLLDDISLRPASQAPQLNMPSKICSGQSLLDLGQYVNTNGGIFSGVGITSSIVTTSTGSVTLYNFNAAQTMTNGLYTITYSYTDNINCSQTAIQQVSICNIFDGANLAYASTTACVNGGTLSVISPSGSYNYTWQPGNFIGTNYTVAPNITTNYSVFGSNTSTCNVTGSIIVTPNEAFVQLNVNPQPACPGNSVQITAIGNYTSILWQPNSFTTGVISVSPSVPSTYSVIVTSHLGCTSTATTIVAIASSPTVNILVSNAIVCAGNASTLTATGTSYYFWDNYNMTPVNIVNPTTTTIYSVTGTDLNNCSSTATAIVKVHSTNISLKGSTEICAGESVTLTAQSGANTYAWFPVNLYTSAIVVFPNATTVYSVYATIIPAGNYCTATSTIQINVNECMGIENQKLLIKQFNIYPNPSDGTFTIASEKKTNLEIKIYNESGQIIKDLILDESNNHKLIISDLPTGFYIAESEDMRSKLIITK